MVLDAVRLPAAEREGDDPARPPPRRVDANYRHDGKPCGSRPRQANRQPQTPEEQARKEQILTNPGKGIQAGLRERKETIHVAAE
jgi:hypothetical protein